MAMIILPIMMTMFLVLNRSEQSLAESCENKNDGCWAWATEGDCGSTDYGERMDDNCCASCSAAYAADLKWNRVCGMRQISLGDDKIVGVERNGDVFYRKGIALHHPYGTSWKKIPGKNLTYIAVGDGKIIGVNSRDEIWSRTKINRYNPAGTGWQRILGSLKQISVGDGKMMGVTSSDEIYSRKGISNRNPYGEEWVRVDGSLKYVSVGDGKIMGVTSDDQVLNRIGISESEPYGKGWKQIEGRLKQISLGNGEIVGVSSDGKIWSRKGLGPGTGWRNIFGRLKSLTLGNGRAMGISDNYWLLYPTEKEPSRTVTVNGEWGMWSLYGDCSLTCGGGQQQRNRLCNSPSSSNGGLDCLLSDGSGARSKKELESRVCNDQSCPVLYSDFICFYRPGYLDGYTQQTGNFTDTTCVYKCIEQKKIDDSINGVIRMADSSDGRCWCAKKTKIYPSTRTKTCVLYSKNMLVYGDFKCLYQPGYLNGYIDQTGHFTDTTCFYNCIEHKKIDDSIIGAIRIADSSDGGECWCAKKTETVQDAVYKSCVLNKLDLYEPTDDTTDDSLNDAPRAHMSNIEGYHHRSSIRKDHPPGSPVSKNLESHPQSSIRKDHPSSSIRKDPPPGPPFLKNVESHSQSSIPKDPPMV